LAIGIPIALFALWQWGADSGRIDTKFFPAPTTIWTTAVDMFESGELQHAVWVSTWRVLQGFAWGSVIGVAVGLLMGMSRTLRAALDPLLTALYTVPKLALLPLLLLIFGLGDGPKIILIAITVFFFMWISTMAAIIGVPDGYREAATSFGASRLQMLRQVLFPAALPEIFVGLRISAGVSILTLVAIEFVNATDGIGYTIWFSWSLFLAQKMYVGIVVVALMGLIFTSVIRWIGKKLTPWASHGGLDTRF
jgi:ABC-type nitrate/sulfonate/bicarbonate transport system permease component